MCAIPGDFNDDPARVLWERLTQAEFDTISAWLTSRPTPIGKIATALGLTVIADGMDVNIAGQIKKVADAPARFEITVNVADVPVRQRFTVAHEIAHYLLHRSQIDLDGIVDTILFRSSLSTKYEVEANRFAAALLMPWPRIREFADSVLGHWPTQNDLVAVSKAFRVSELTAGYRLGL